MYGSDVRSDPRIAGCVTRYHTWPRIRDQSVGEHTWQVLRLIYVVCPNPTEHLIRATISHDVGEIATGDAPYPVKAENPILKKEMDRLETQAVLGMALPWSLPPPALLTEAERCIFKIAEFLEMWEWGLQEHQLGSKFGLVVADRCIGPATMLIEQGVARGWVSRVDLDHRIAPYIRRRCAVWDYPIPVLSTPQGDKS